MKARGLKHWMLLVLVSILVMGCEAGNSSNQGSIDNPVDIGTAPTSFDGYVAAWNATTSGESFYVVTISPGGTYNFTATGLTSDVDMVIFRDSSFSTIADWDFGPGDLSVPSVTTTTETKLYIYLSNNDDSKTSHTLTVN